MGKVHRRPHPSRSSVLLSAKKGSSTSAPALFELTAASRATIVPRKVRREIHLPKTCSMAGSFLATPQAGLSLSAYAPAMGTKGSVGHRVLLVSLRSAEDGAPAPGPCFSGQEPRTGKRKGSRRATADTHAAPPTHG